MYAEGKGVTKNLVQAYAWLAVAIDNGNKESGRLQKKIEKQLTASELNKAQALATRYINSYGKIDK